MKLKFVYFFTAILMLATLTQCKDSLTQGNEGGQNIKIEKVNLIIPAVDSEQPTSLTLRWEDTKTVDSFQVQLSGEKDFSSTLVDSVVDSTHLDVQGLPHDTTLYWKVSSNTVGSDTTWSEVWNFRTVAKPAGSASNVKPAKLRVSILVSSADKAKTATSVLLKWEGPSNVDNYKVQVAWNDYFPAPIVDETVGKNSLKASGLDKERTYYWRVQATGDGDSGNWSSVHSFTPNQIGKQVVAPTKTPQTNLLSPADKAKTATSVLLKWEGPSSIDNYKVQVAWNDYFPNPVVDETVSKNSFQVTKVDNGRTYYWRVQALDDGDTQNWSEVWSFTPVEGANSFPGAGNVGSADNDSNDGSDRAALMDLYKATNGGQWSNNSGWGSDAPLGKWYGINTNAQGRVTRIDLWHNNLTGNIETIPWGNLDKVKYLNIKYNHLTGSIPSQIGNMTSLEWLILQGRNYEIGGRLKEPPKNMTHGYHQGKYYSNTNNFSGQIPAEIGNLSNLEMLEISNAPNITGPIPPELGDLSNLKGLYLSGANFTGYTIPSSFGRLTNLKHIYIEGAGLVGQLPASFQNLTQLTQINFGGFDDTNTIPSNSLTGEIPDMSQFHNLRTVIFDENKLTGKYPSYWNNGNFTYLNTLRFSWNNLTGTLHGFENLPHMKSFSVHGNELTGSINPITTIGPQVKIINIGLNNFSGDFPQSGWPDFFQLKTVRMNRNQLTGNIPCSFWEKLDNPELRRAWFDGNNIDNSCARAAKAMVGHGSIKLALP